MDSSVLIMIGCAIATITGLNFMELRKIRKHLERPKVDKEVSRGASAVAREVGT